MGEKLAKGSTTTPMLPPKSKFNNLLRTAALGGGILILLFVSYRIGYQRGTTSIAPTHAVVNREYYPTLLSLIQNARERIDIIMFQVFDYERIDPFDTLYNALINAAKRGVKVRVLAEGGEDYLGASFFERSNRALSKLVSNGINVRVDSKGTTTHAKVVIVDKTLLIGSTNWNYYAFFKNNEANLLIRSIGAVKELENYFNELWKESKPFIPGQKPIKGELSPIAKILLNAEDFDGKEVTIKGTVSQFQIRVSSRGNPYSLFRLRDSGGSIKVYTRGHPDIREGNTVTVKGIFNRVRRVGKYTFYNEIEAIEVKKENFN